MLTLLLTFFFFFLVHCIEAKMATRCVTPLCRSGLHPADERREGGVTQTFQNSNPSSQEFCLPVARTRANWQKKKEKKKHSSAMTRRAFQ